MTEFFKRIGAALSCAALGGCVTAVTSDDPTHAIAQSPHPSLMLAFDGATGESLAWSTVLDRIAQADAVFVGETHDDACAHATEHALVEAFLASHERAAVSLEFLERNDQPATDAYLAGSISLDEFLSATNSRDWAGKGTWVPWYQPMIDSARRCDARVIAANAPRTYVSRARKENYAALRALPYSERMLFEIDDGISRDADWKRLRDIMIEMQNDHAASGETPGAPTDDEMDAMHRSQRMWDRTMGLSAANAYVSGWSVIHLAGGFHLEDRLGTVAQFRFACAAPRILVISLQPLDTVTMDPTDAHGADIVVHTHATRAHGTK